MIIEEVIKLTKQFPLSYEDVLYCYMSNKCDVDKTKRELEEYVVKGY
jgi:hypothetical protein